MSWVITDCQSLKNHNIFLEEICAIELEQD